MLPVIIDAVVLVASLVFFAAIDAANDPANDLANDASQPANFPTDYSLDIRRDPKALPAQRLLQIDPQHVYRWAFTQFQKGIHQTLWRPQRTNGMTQLEIKAALSAYTPNHTLLAYGTNQDLNIFHRFRRCMNNSPLATNIHYQQDIDIRTSYYRARC
ncbi:hypothetical protein H2200_013634 [Cladophialophora chaetospira]|uniref:Uncharacterized protein n=1 Tax=Cladophialophora chaetospira TaxID=386627 RepID=A0AA38WUE2_9EURO|nr:hypothetical protein H2200_013634 [Cladophialophora chaetospira]